MRIVVFGGSGVIGAHVVDVLRGRGHEVSTAARTARAGVDHVLDLESATVEALRPVLAGADGVVYAARTDEAGPVRRPVYPVLRERMVATARRLFTAARQEGLTRGAVMGSYYTYFARRYPQWRLATHHAYVRCRLEQAAAAREAAGPGLPVAVLELPFVFGRAGDRLPNWAGALDRWARSRLPLVAPDGGTAAATVGTVAQVAADALERGSGADLPVADENLSWHDMVARIAAAVGRGRRVRRLPTGAARAALRLGGGLQSLTGRESGVDPRYAADLLLAEQFVEPVTGRPVEPALRETFPSR